MKKNKFAMQEIAKTIIKEATLPDIIDYCNPDSFISAEIHSADVQMLGYLNYGESEGIYLDVFLKEGKTFTHIITAKTLCDNKVAMIEMGRLHGELTYHFSKFVSKHWDELEELEAMEESEVQ